MIAAILRGPGPRRTVAGVAEPPDGDAWQPWHPSEVARILAGTDVPWAVAGGWAIDLHLGRQTRAHEDIEVAIPRDQFPAFRRELTAFDLYQAADGGVRPLGAGRVAHGSPDLGARSGDPPVADGHVPGAGRRPDLGQPSRRADPAAAGRGVRRRTPDGIPYLAPATVLLAKAKHVRDKDEADLALTLPTLTDDEQRWLAGALALAHPGHRWLADLGSA